MGGIPGRRGENAGTVKLDGNTFLRAEDKVIQVNASPKLEIRRFVVHGFKTFLEAQHLREEPNRPYNVLIDGLKARDGSTVIRLKNSRGKAVLRGLKLAGVKRVSDTAAGAQVRVG